MNEQTKAVFLLFITAILWSLGGLFIKLVEMNPLAIAGIRSGISAIFIFSFVKDIKLKITKIEFAGGIAYAFTVILFVIANKLTTAANAILLQYTAPVFVAIMSPIFLSERIRRLDWITIIIVFFGMYLFFIDDLETKGMWGNFIAILSGISFASLVILLRYQKSGNPLQSILIGNIITAAIGIPFVHGTTFNLDNWIYLLILGIFQLGLPYILYTKAIKKVNAMEASIIPILEPILNPIWVLIIVNETPGINSIFGGVIVLGAVTLRSILLIIRRKNFSVYNQNA